MTRVGSQETTCTDAGQTGDKAVVGSPLPRQNPTPTSVPDADTAHLLPRVAADPCTQPLLMSGGYGEVRQALVAVLFPVAWN